MKYLIYGQITLLLLINALCDDIVRLTKIEVVGDNIEGEVEFYYDEIWRPLCARMWSKTSANVICKTIGFEEGAAEAKRNDLYGMIKRRSYYYLYEGLQCSGIEMSVEKCSNWNNKVMDLKICSEGIAIAVCKR